VTNVYLIYVGAAIFLGPLIILAFWIMRWEEREYKRLKKSGRI
jgi:hypothetical protein